MSDTLTSVLGEVTAHVQLNTWFWAEIQVGESKRYYRSKGWRPITEGTAGEITEEQFISDINRIKQSSGDFKKLKEFFETLA